MSVRVVVVATATFVASALLACGGLNGNTVLIDGIDEFGGAGGTHATGGSATDSGGSSDIAGRAATAGTSSMGGTQEIGGSSSTGGKGGNAEGGSSSGGVGGTSGGVGGTSTSGGVGGTTAGVGGTSAGAGGGAGCNTVTQRCTTASGQPYPGQTIPTQTRGTVVPGTYALQREDFYSMSNAGTPALSTIEVTVNGTHVTVNFLNVHIIKGTFKFDVTLPAATNPPTPLTTIVSCSSSAVLSAGSTLNLDYSALPNGVLALAYIDFNTVATYTKL